MKINLKEIFIQNSNILEVSIRKFKNFTSACTQGNCRIYYINRMPKSPLGNTYFLTNCSHCVTCSPQQFSNHFTCQWPINVLPSSFIICDSVENLENPVWNCSVCSEVVGVPFWKEDHKFLSNIQNLILFEKWEFIQNTNFRNIGKVMSTNNSIYCNILNCKVT